MKFPKWDDNPKLRDAERARLRRKHMLRMTAIEVCPSGSIRDFAKRCGVDRTTIYYAIRGGTITQELAERLQNGAGRNDDGKLILPAEYLISPLTVPSE